MQGGYAVKRMLILLLCAALAATLFAGCATEESPYIPTGDALEGFSPPTVPTEPDNTQALSLGYFPESTTNPYNCTNIHNRVLFPLMYQSLFAIDENYGVWPVLCQRYEVSDDLKVHTFYIAEATFPDGTMLNAHDVAGSLNYALHSAYYSGRFKYIEKIQVLDTMVLQITTSTPYGDLPLLLDIPICKYGTETEEFPMGTGAYVVEETVSGLRLRRRTFWWCKPDNWPVTAEYIPLVPVDSVSELRNQFEYGNVSVICADPGSITYSEVRCDYELWDMESGIFVYLALNSRCEVFQNDVVRSAMVRCIDRNFLVDNYYGGIAGAAYLPCSPQSPFYSKQLAASYGFSIEALKAAIAQEGFVDEEVTILLNRQDPERLAVGREIAKVLEECGLKVIRNEFDEQVYNVFLEWFDYDLHLGQTRLSPNMDISQFFSGTDPLSIGGLESMPRFAMSMEALANSGNYYNLHKLIMQDGQLIPVLFRNYAVYVQRGLFTDLYPARDNLFFYSLGRTLEDAMAPEEVPEEAE